MPLLHMKLDGQVPLEAEPIGDDKDIDGGLVDPDRQRPSDNWPSGGDRRRTVPEATRASMAPVPVSARNATITSRWLLWPSPRCRRRASAVGGEGSGLEGRAGTIVFGATAGTTACLSQSIRLATLVCRWGLAPDEQWMGHLDYRLSMTRQKARLQGDKVRQRHPLWTNFQNARVSQFRKWTTSWRCPQNQSYKEVRSVEEMR